jgi:hypothetical protein
MGVRQKNAFLCLDPITASESGTIFLDIVNAGGRASRLRTGRPEKTHSREQHS